MWPSGEARCADFYEVQWFGGSCQGLHPVVFNDVWTLWTAKGPGSTNAEMVKLNGENFWILFYKLMGTGEIWKLFEAGSTSAGF